jgi:hypothetical protein
MTTKHSANELADALQETEPYYSTDYKLFDKAATMLRQQQAEIEALKTGGEPKAWLFKHNKVVDFTKPQKGDDNWQPLYTHPHPDNLGFALSIIDQQKLEIERLKADKCKYAEAVAEALASIPAMSDVGEFFFEHHDINGEYLGFERVDPIEVIQHTEEILKKAQGK